MIKRPITIGIKTYYDRHDKKTYYDRHKNDNGDEWALIAIVNSVITIINSMIMGTNEPYYQLYYNEDEWALLLPLL